MGQVLIIISFWVLNLTRVVIGGLPYAQVSKAIINTIKLYIVVIGSKAKQVI